MWIEELKSGRYRGGFRNPATGRKVQRTFDYEYEAEAWASSAEEAALKAAQAGSETSGGTSATSDPTVPATSRQIVSARLVERPFCPTVAEYAETYLRARRGHIARGTWEQYEIQLRLGVCADPILSTMRLDDVTRGHVDTWISDMISDGRTGRPSVNRRLKVFRAMLGYAMDNDLISRDPTRRIKYLPTDIRTGRRVSPEEDARLLAACRTPEERAMLLLALDAGLRWGEVAGLPLSAISGDYITVRQVVERSSRAVRGYPKGKRPRVVPISTRRLRDALSVVSLMAETRGPDALLFVTIKADGIARPIDASIWRNGPWRALCHRAKVNPRGGTRLTFHDLRHTYGSLLAAAGVPRSEIAALMGHADESTTAIYIHAGSDGHRLDLVTRALVGSA